MERLSHFALIASTIAGLQLIASAQLLALASQSTVKADKVFTNAKVYTLNEKQPWAEAVAVKGNKIVYVGEAKGAAKVLGEGTEKFDLAGKMLLPGFISAHDHLVASNWTNGGVDLFSAKSKEDYLRLIKEYAEANPDEKVIRGIGWNLDAYGGYPHYSELDAVVPDRPAFILLPRFRYAPPVATVIGTQLQTPPIICACRFLRARAPYAQSFLRIE